MDLYLRGKTALVTGASQGIGQATAFQLAEEGCDLHLVSRDGDRLHKVAEAVREQYGVEAKVTAEDLASDGAASRIAESVEKLDILVNNAGAIPAGALHQVDDQMWKEAWDLKVFGYIGLARALYERLRDREGVMINIIGVAGETFVPANIATTTGNAALLAFTRALGKSAMHDHVRVIGINPGPVSTPRLEAAFRSRAQSELGDADRWLELTRELPYERAATPEEVAYSVAFLASPRSGYTNGTVLGVHGGIGI